MKNKFKICGDVTIIYLNRRDGTKVEAYISTVDLPKVDRQKGTWFAQWSDCTNSFYVCIREGKKRVQLHRLIMNTPEGYETDHKNHITTDNRRENLRNVTREDNASNRRDYARSYIRFLWHWNKIKNKWMLMERSRSSKAHVFVGYFDSKVIEENKKVS